MATERKKTGSRSSSSAGRKTSGRSRKRNKKQSTVQEAIGFALIVLGVFSFAAVVIGSAGWLGKGLADVFFGLFGLGAYLVPVLMAGIGWIVLTAGKFRLQKTYGASKPSDYSGAYGPFPQGAERKGGYLA